MNASAVNIPLVNSTQILTTTQAPAASVVTPTPLVASTPVVSQVPMVASTPIVSQAPMVGTNMQHFVNQPIGGVLVDEDYRLGRGILDEFRPPALQAQYGVVVPNTTNVVATTALPVASTQVLPTSAVVPASTVVPTAVVPTGGANTLKEFL